MFCPNCGQQIPEGSMFCILCGANLQYQPPREAPVNLQNANGFCVASVIRSALASTKFLVMCILMSVATLLYFGPFAVLRFAYGWAGTTYSFNIMGILIVIAMWITYANAKSRENMMSIGGLKFSSGIAQAVVICNWIAVGIFLVCGVLVLVCLPYLVTMSEETGFMGDYDLALSGEIFDSFGIVENDHIYDELFSTKMVRLIYIILSVVLIISSIIITLLNVFYYSKIQKFARNLHVSYVTNRVTDLRFKTVSTWFMVLGILGIICSFVGLLTSPIGALSSILSSVTLIVSSTWVKSLGEAVAKIPQPIYTNNFYNNNYNAYNNFNM